MTDNTVAFMQRVAGGCQRVYWSGQDLERLARHYGVSDRALSMAAASIPRTPSAMRAPVPAARSAESSKTFVFTISTPTVDLMGDTIAIDGWRLGNFRKNPVVLQSHDAGMLPVGRSPRIWIDGKRLRSEVEFVPDDAEAQRVATMVGNGYLRAASVGFVPLKFAFVDDPARRFGIDFLEQTLLEWSIVAVPANPEALIDAAGASKSGKPLDPAEARRRARLLDLTLMRMGPRS